MEIDLNGINNDSIKPLDDIDNVENDNNDIHIRIQKRNGKKSWTFIENVDCLKKDDDKFLNKLKKSLSKKFNCSVTLKTSNKLGKEIKVMQLQGDHRREIKQFLIESKFCKEKNIHMHGF